MTDPSVIGSTGQVTVTIPGGNQLGQVHVSVRGGSENFLAQAAKRLERGTRVLVVDTVGPRTVVVTEWDPGFPGTGTLTS